MAQQAQLQPGAAANVVDERGSEDGQAGPPRVADTGVDDSVGLARKEALRQALRPCVTGRNRLRAEIPRKGVAGRWPVREAVCCRRRLQRDLFR